MKESKPDSTILLKIQSGEFTGLFPQLQEFLKPLLNAASLPTSLSNKELKYRSDVALRFLHSFCSRFDSLPPDIVSSSISAVVESVQCCLSVNSTPVKDPPTVAKLLVHLVSKYAKSPLFLIDEACQLVDWLMQSLLSSGEQLSSDSANLAEVAATYLWHGCSEMSKNLSKSRPDASNPPAFKGFCRSLKMFFVGMKNFDRFPDNFSIALRTWKHCLTDDQAMGVFEEVSSLLRLAPTLLIQCKALCLPLVCCMAEITFQCESFFLRHARTREASDLNSLLKVILKDKLPSNIVGKVDSNVLLVLLECFDDQIRLVSNNDAPRKCRCHIPEEVTVKFSEQMSLKLRKSTVLTTKLHHNTFVSVLRVIDGTVNLVLGTGKPESLSDHVLEAAMLLLDLRSQLCSLCNAVMRAQLLADSRTRLVDFEQSEVTSQMKKMDLHCMVIQRRSSDIHKKENCLKDLSSLEEFVSRFTAEKLLTTYEHVRLGNLAFRVGWQFYSSGCFAGAEQCMNVCVSQYRSYVTSGPTEADLVKARKKLQISKTFEVLSDALKKQDRIEDAITATVDCYLEDEQHPGVAVLSWQRIMTKLEEKQLFKRVTSLTRLVKERLVGTKRVFDELNLLKEEFSSLHKSKSGVSSYHRAVVEDLLSLSTCDDLTAALALIDKAHLLNAVSTTTSVVSSPSAVDLCKEAIRRLDAVDNKPSCVVLDVKARAYASLYVLRSPDHVDKLFESASRAITNVTRKQSSLSPTSTDEDDSTSEDNLEMFTLCSQLAAEATLLEPVNTALSLWETCFASEDRIEIDDATVDYIEVLVIIYKLMGQSTLLLRAIRLLSRVASLAGDSQRRLVADTELVSLCNTVLQSRAAFECIEQIEFWLKNGSGVEAKCPRQYMEFLLAKAESCLLANELDKCSAVLNTARSSRISSLKPSSRDDILIEASIVLLEAKLRAADLAARETTDASGSSLVGDLPLELSVTSTRQIGGLIQYMFSEKRAESGRHKGGDCMAEKWKMIHLLYCSIFYTGVSYVHAGDQREAKCYLLQCLRFCEAFRLRKRFSEVHLALAQLSVVSGRFNDCAAHLNIVRFILDPHSSKGLSLESNPQQNSSSEASSPSSDASGDFIRSRVMTLDYGTSADPTGSPKHTRRVAAKSPMTWSHPVGCECIQCSDSALESLWLSCYVVDAVSRLRQGQTADAEKMILAAYKQINRLVKNVAGFVSKLSMKKLDCSKDGKISLAESIFQFIFCEIYLRLCELALIKNNKVDHFSSLYTQALDLMQQSYFPSSRFHLAELYYLSSMPGLVWPSSAVTPGVSQITAIDMLCAGIGRMKASDVATPPARQRVIKCQSNDPQTVEIIGSDSNEGAGRRGKKKSAVMVAAPVKKRPAGKLGVQHAASGLELAELPRMCAPNTVDCKPLSGKFPFDQLSTIETSSAQSDSVSAMLVTSQHACDQLRSAFDIQHHNPTTTLYRSICNTVAAELFAGSFGKDSVGSWQIGHYLSEAQSTTFRHACLLNIARKMRKLEAGDSSTNHRQALQSVREKMMFGTSLVKFKDVIHNLPPGLVVCQLSVVASVGQAVGRLYLTRFQRNCDPITVSLPGYSTPQGQRLLVEFDGLMQDNRNSMVVTDKAEWWSRRRELDTKLHDFLAEVDRQYVGCWRGVLLGRLTNDDDVSKVQSAAEKLVTKFDLKNVNRTLLQLFLEAVHLDTMTDQDLAAGLQHAIDCELSKQTLIQLIVTVKQIASRLNLEACTRGPISLVLDRSVQHLPWENIPVLVNQSVVRLPSVHFLAAHHHAMSDYCPSSVLNTGIHRQSVYYVINPDNNLPNTQQTFQPWFEKEPGWKGVTGRPPTANEMIDAITKHDFFIYCGHGTGSAYLVEETLQQQSCQAAVMLMGCSSGRLIAQGELDASGTLLHYFLAGSGCIIGNMWDVTDRDIDRFQEVTLHSWLNGSCETGLLEAMREGRSACKLRWLTGAAPVMYGFPIKIAGTSATKSAPLAGKWNSKSAPLAGKWNPSTSEDGKMEPKPPSTSVEIAELSKAAPSGSESEPHIATSKRAVLKRTSKK